MKILILANSMMGLMSFRKELLQALKYKGYDVVVSAPYDKYFDGQLDEIGCNFINTPIDHRGINPLTDIKLIIHYVKLLHDIHPDVVLSFTIKPNLYGGLACRLTNTRQMVNITGLGTALENQGLLQKFIIVLYKICLKKIQVMFFQNTSNMDFCKKHCLIKGKPVLLPGSGVNLTRFQYSPLPTDDKIKFIFVGRVMRQKGIDEYLYAAECIKKEFPNAEFHILGTCHDSNYITRINFMQKAGYVVYDGVTSDVRSFLYDMHCTIHPTFYPEGMSNVLLESCASGRPIITTNRPGCKEIVEDGKTGYVCRERDAEDLVAKVRMFLNLSAEQRLAMGKAAREKVEREFDRQIVVNHYLTEIENINADV